MEQLSVFLETQARSSGLLTATGYSWIDTIISLTLLEAEGVGLMEEHGVEQQSTVLAVGDRCVARIVFFQECNCIAWISVEILKAPVIWAGGRRPKADVCTPIKYR